jgi:hypothetical protein
MQPRSHQHKKVEDSTELDIKKKEIFEAIIFPPIRAEPDESTSNEVQTIDNAHLQSNIVHLYSCGVCNVSFTHKMIRKD